MTAEQALLAAREVAEIARHMGEIPVGAVVVFRDAIVARAHNRCESLRDATAHAEMLALRQASEVIGDWRLNECTLAVTLEPCAMCAGAMVNARLGRLLFGAFDTRFGACGSALALTDGALGWRVPHVGGVCESACRALLDAHFDAARKRHHAD